MGNIADIRAKTSRLEVAAVRARQGDATLAPMAHVEWDELVAKHGSPFHVMITIFSVSNWSTNSTLLIPTERVFACRTPVHIRQSNS